MKFALALVHILILTSFAVARPSSSSQQQQHADHAPAVQVVPKDQAVEAVGPVAAPVAPVVASHVAPTVPVVPVAPISQVAPVAAEPSVVVHHAPQAVISQYSPAAVVSVVNEPAAAVVSAASGNAPASAAGVKPAVPAHGEQYGQPESAAIPANYKPFGSWGLYIGGNPADGYYTNYYKSLSSSVDKQVATGASSVADKPVRPLNPLLRHVVSSSPYQGADYYPFSYSAVDFAANPAFGPQSLSYSSLDSPLVPSPYIPESYSTKRVGNSPAKGGQSALALDSQQQQQEQHQVKSSAKGAVQQPHFYAAPVSNAIQAAIVPATSIQQQQQQQQQQQAQVVAYPVPVGSQIVGSQVGVDGAFFPYGVHAFTKYAIKPTVVDSAVQAAAYQPSVYHSGAYSPAHLAVVHPGYKFGAAQSVGSSIHQHPSYYSNLSGYYAYPAVHDFEK